MKPLCEMLETRWLFVVDLVCYGVNNVTYDPETSILKCSTSVTNTGTGTIPIATVNKVFLSTDKVVNNSDDITLGSVANALIPNTGTIGKVDFEIDLTEQPAGEYYVGVALDSNGTVPEPDNLNNYRFSSNQITIDQMINVVIQGTDSGDYMVASQVTDKVTFAMNGKNRRTVDADRIASILIQGLGGNDTIMAASLILPVVIEGGDGKDYLTGSTVNDTLSGNASADLIYGGGGNDRLNGNGGNDRLYGEGGADRIYGYDGNDLLDGGSSNDRLEGGYGSDTIYGQSGNDSFYAKDLTIDQLYGGSGIDTAVRDSFDVIASIL